MKRTYSKVLMALSLMVTMTACSGSDSSSQDTESSQSSKAHNQSRSQKSLTTAPEFGFTVQLYGDPNAKAVGLADFKRAMDDLEGKVTWIRFYIQEWEMMYAIESPTSINFNTSYLDRYKEALQYAKQKGFKVQVNVATPLREDAQKFQHHDYVELVRTQFTFLAGYFPGVDVWQVINEGNISCFRTWNRLWEPNWMIPDLRPEVLRERKLPDWTWGSRPLAVNYLKELADVMAAARQGIRSRSNAPITTSISGAPSIDPTLTAKTLQHLYYYIDAIRPSIDMIGMDVYLALPNIDGNYQKAYDQIPDFFQKLRDRYPDKMVMVAETGVSSQGWKRDEAQQVHVLLKSVKALVDAGVSRVLIYEYRNSVWSQGGLFDPEFTAIENGFGIVTAGTDARKPAYEPIMNYIRTGSLPTSPVDEVTQPPARPNEPIELPAPPPVDQPVGSRYCGATVDARYGSSPGNVVEKFVSNQSECFAHCKLHVRSEDQAHWLNPVDAWNMCWYDGMGFINSNGVATAPATLFCEATHDARFGTIPSNQIPTQVRSRSECLQHCDINIRDEDKSGWKDGWNMCWFHNDGFIR